MTPEGPEIVKAPWTTKQVKELNDYQKAHVFHPYICSHCRDIDTAREDVLLREGWSWARICQELRDERLLTATRKGWVCKTCDYTQDWALIWMVNGAWRRHAQRMAQLFDAPGGPNAVLSDAQQVEWDAESIESGILME